MLVRHLAALTAVSLVVALASACGSSDNSEFGNGGNNGTNPNDPNGGAFAGDDAGTLGGPGGLGDLQACATSSANGALTPVDLIFMYDKTGSMNDGIDDSKNPPPGQSKWDLVQAGTTAFFQDSKSAGMSAALTFFSANKSSDCSPSKFSTPKVPLTPLPSTAFAGAISSQSPGGSTPTLDAETGAVNQAKAAATANPSHKIAIVMVTDGEPQGCSDDGDIGPASSVAQTADKGTPAIPTYVIGVGPSLSNLNTLAASGGTGQAFIVNNGTSAVQDLINALNQIRGQVGSCSFTLPPPPAGQTLDTNAVNVQFTPSGGAPQTLTYNGACTGGDGWHYDNAAAPTQVVLCPNACNQAKSDTGGKITIAFGCATKGGVK